MDFLDDPKGLIKIFRSICHYCKNFHWIVLIRLSSFKLVKEIFLVFKLFPLEIAQLKLTRSLND